MGQSDVRPFRVEPPDVVLELLLEPPYRLEEEQALPNLVLHRPPETVDFQKFGVAERGVAPPDPGSGEKTSESPGSELSTPVGNHSRRPAPAVDRLLKEPRRARRAGFFGPNTDRQHSARKDVDDGADRDRSKETPNLREIEDVYVAGPGCLDRMACSAGLPGPCFGRRMFQDPLDGRPRRVKSQSGQDSGHASRAPAWPLTTQMKGDVTDQVGKGVQRLFRLDELGTGAGGCPSSSSGLPAGR